MIREHPTPEPRNTSSGVAIKELVGDLRDEVATLFKTTTSLFRQELEENVDHAGRALRSVGIGFAVLAIGSLMAVLGLDLLLITLLAPDILSYESAAVICTLSLAGILTVAGIILAKRSAGKLSADQLIPYKTLKTIEEHGDWIARKAEDLIK